MKQLFYDDLRRNITQVRSILNDANTILLITHANCMDGMGCELLMEKLFSSVIVMKSSPQKVNDLVANLDASKYDAIVFADISTTNEDFLNNKHVMLVDHHDTASNLHDPDNLIFVYDFECGSKLLKRVIEAAKRKPLKQLDDLVDIINDYDLWIHNDKRSKKLAKTFYSRKSDEEFAERFWNFKVSFTQEEEEKFEEDAIKYEQIYNQLEIFELDQTLTGFAVFGSYNNDLCHDIMVRNKLRVAIIFNTQTRCASIRTVDEEVHLGEMMKEYGTGGGHPMAAGFRAINDDKLRDTLEFIDDYLYQNYPSLRK